MSDKPPPATGLWVPGGLPSLNDLIAAAKGAGGTGRMYSALKRKWTNDIALLAKASKLGPYDGPVFLTFSWVEKERRRDPDNVAGGGRKLVLDGLVTAGVLKGDGWAHIAGWSDTFAIGDKPGVRVEIRAQPLAHAAVISHRTRTRHSHAFQVAPH